MIIRSLKISIILIFLLSTVSLYGQERQNAKEEARQHYQQGKEYYSQGRYQEAASEFEKATEALTPARIQFEQTVEVEAKKAITPPAPAELPKKIQIKGKTEEEKKEEEKKGGIEEAVVAPALPKEISPLTEEREYYLDVGDVLDISVWQIPDLSRPEVILRPDGKISFPLIGDIKAEGLTLTQLDNIITEKLKTYVKSPEVSVMIRYFGEQANKVVILGEIISPGVYKFGSAPTITEVIASAGGYTKYAVLNSIMIIRGDVRTKPEAVRVNVAQILKSGNLSQNIFLKPNDIIYVPRSFIGKINTFLEIFQPAINEYMQTLNARHLQQVVHSKGGI